MARYLTQGIVVLAADHPGTEFAVNAGLQYAARTIVVADDAVPEVEGAQFDRPKGGASVDSAFRRAAADQIPWVAMPRDLADPQTLLAEVLTATGKRVRKDLPGFAVLFTGRRGRPVRRILAIVDRTDGQPSGFLVLAAVVAAQATGAQIDVLLMDSPETSVTTPSRLREAVHVTREKDFHDQAIRRAEESGIEARWITVEGVTDKPAVVLEQLAEADYDLVIDDLGSITLGGRLGRSRRIEQALDATGPAGIVSALLEHSDVPLALVLDGVRLGLLPPGVVKGGAGAVLAFGILASSAPAAAAGPGALARQQESVTQTVDAVSAALQEAAAMASPAEVNEAASVAVAVATGQEGDVQLPAAQGADVAETVAQNAEEVSDVAPAELAPQDLTPESAPKVDSSKVDVDKDVTADDVSHTQHKSKKTKSAADDAADAFDDAQKAAIKATDAAADAAQAADEAATDLQQAEQAYQQASATAVTVVSDATGLVGLLPGGPDQAGLDAAEAPNQAALSELADLGSEAVTTLTDYQDAAADAADAQAELTDAAAAVTEADAAHKKAAATAKATESAYRKAIADSRAAPVSGGHVGTGYGVSGSHWSTGRHTGVDYPASVGTRVSAAGSGKVISAGYDGAYGNRVVIQHENGYESTYNHLSQISVHVGDTVVTGDKIGEVGETGNAFGPHLHFEVAKGGDGWGSGSFVDPAAWLNGDIG